MQRGYVHGGDIYAESIYVHERTYIWREHTDGGDIHTKGIYTRRGHTHGGDIHAEGLTHGGDIYIVQTVQIFWIICLAAYLLDGLDLIAQQKLVNKKAAHSLDKI